MKIISWNLNGLMSCIKNGAFKPITHLAPDVICLQEIRTRQESDERSNFEALLDTGFTDVYRYLYPDERSYTWWSNRLN